MTGKVTVYTTKDCPDCMMVTAFLEKHGVPYESIDAGAGPEAARKMIELSGRESGPVTTVDDEVIVGFDARRLNELFGEPAPGQIFDVLIVGAGPAGLTAGVYCARKLLRTMIISENIGGQALESWAIENYLGYRMVTGEDLMKKFEEQVRNLDLGIEIGQVTGIAREGDHFLVTTLPGTTLTARCLILAQGKRPRKLGVPGEDQYLGRGLSVCPTCDGPLFRAKKVAVVGGGNSALQTAIEMSGIAQSVSLIVRSTIRADPDYQKKVGSKNNITVYLHSRVSALHGGRFLTGITITDEQGGEQTLSVDGVFIEIGWLPNTGLLRGFVDLNREQEIVVDINGHTSREGVFAAGDVTSVKGKQIIIAAGEGAKAALEASEYIMKMGE